MQDKRRQLLGLEVANAKIKMHLNRKLICRCLSKFLSSLPINLLSFPLDFWILSGSLQLTPFFLPQQFLLAVCSEKIPLLTLLWLSSCFWTLSCFSLPPSPFTAWLSYQMLDLTGAKCVQRSATAHFSCRGEMQPEKAPLQAFPCPCVASWLQSIVSLPLSCRLPLLIPLSVAHRHMATPQLWPASESIYVY